MKCVLLLYRSENELEVNKSFNFKEIETSNKILTLINKNFKTPNPHISLNENN